MEQHIYKILRPSEWADARSTRLYQGSADDIRDGFIHFSTFSQMKGTAEKYFSEEQIIYVLEFETAVFPEALMKWEKSRDDALFPHLYAPLDVTKAQKTVKLEQGASTGFDFSMFIGD